MTRDRARAAGRSYRIPLGALSLATPLAIGYWMGVQVAACYLALVLARRVLPGLTSRLGLR